MKNLFFTIIFFISGFTLAQKVKVLDQQTGKIVKNTSIFNDKETINITTDVNGFADISEFKNNEIVVFSHLSYAVLRIKKSIIKSKNYIIYLTTESEQLDEVVISLFKKEEKTTRIAEQIAVLNARDIQKVSPQTSADLLATIPGIKVQKSQFGGGSPVIRGMESNRVLLVVDGVRMNNAIYRKGHLQSSITVTPNMLDKTEVVFGPSSVVYGSDALGGVIHYYTKTPKLSQENEVESQLFSRFSTVNQEVTTNVSAEIQKENWASLTSVSYSDFGDLKAGKNRSHGFKDWGRVFFFSENINGNYNENPTKNSNSNIQRNTGYKQTDILQKFFIPLSKNTDLKVNIQYSTSSDIPRFDRLTELKDGELKFAEWFYGPQKRFLASTQLILNYILFKTGDDFEKILEKTFKEKAKIKHSVFFFRVRNSSKNRGNANIMFYATRYDYLRIAKAMLDDWQKDTCVGKYLKTIFENRISKDNDKKRQRGDRTQWNFARGYAGQFQTHYKGISKKRPVMGMHGRGGQQIVIDFERSRIVVTNAIYEDYNYKKIVYDPIKKGK